jgi:predicted amidophosphoribosyltransferase
MKLTDFFNPNELTCSRCNRPLEVTVCEEFGRNQEYLQCWHCFTSVPSHTMRIPLHKYTNENAAHAPIYHT